MLEMALRQAVEPGSCARAAVNFSALTNAPISASGIGRLALEYGMEAVKADASAAPAMTRVAASEKGVAGRRIPEPDSEAMAASVAGTMVHLREEGWKEARAASVPPAREAGEKAEREPRLTKRSCRAGLRDAETFANHCRVESQRPRYRKSQTDRLRRRWRHPDPDDGFRLFFPPH